jgi:hypothetical protein
LRSLWFDPGRISSFAEWILYLLEMEIYEAFRSRGSGGLEVLDHFSFVEEQVSREVVRKYL